MPSNKTSKVIRKRAKRAREVERIVTKVGELTEDGDLTSGTEAIGHNHCRLLKTSYKTFVKMVDRSSTLQSLRATEANQRFRYDSGDAFSDAIDLLKSPEKECVASNSAYKQMVRDWLIETGRDGTAEEHTKWNLLKGQNAESAKARLDPEWDLVKSWAQSGEDATTAPRTPYLDRLALLCTKANIPRLTALSWIYFYDDRNGAAHRPLPKFEDCPKDGGWSNGLYEATNARKEEAQTLEADGTFTSEQATAYKSAISFRLANAISGPAHDGSVEPTAVSMANANDAHEQAVRRLSAEIAPDFPSKYVEGKWDDIKVAPKPLSNS
ncbi:unnamed protein product [Clonostachys byssicola]|uniref:Uncharacterized protein n=1 Tax=Clonostachys byssicola TaxID=160290 RepID=A0A9N9U936_9HYPO|nr:unnamed protein product [Clonostachys byssicola]